MASNDLLELIIIESDDIRNDTLFTSTAKRFKSIIWAHFHRVDVNRERKAVC